MSKRLNELLHFLDEEQRILFGQLFRYGLSGGLATVVAAAVYWVIATPLHVAPLLANLFAYLGALVIAYFLHSNWSFRGHGTRDNAVRTTSRFFIASLASFGLNSLWVWILTGPLFHGDTWWPIVPMLTVTPLAMFWLNRQWVFD